MNNFRLGRLGRTESADAEPAAGTEPDTAAPATTEVLAPRDEDERDEDVTPREDGALEGPLLPDATGLRGNWQRVQASFVDDPRGSVAEAAALVDHAAQALAGALQQRQRRLRESWDPASGEAADAESPDTEQLRIAMRRYRALFNQVCQP